jgi:single-stranded-DNA-specific exonuclease
LITRPLETRWALHPAHAPERALALARELGAPPAVGQVLLNRGLLDAAAASRFLEPALAQLHDPFQLHGMGAATDRIARAVKEGERIMVHGDYDVDGITATFVLVSALKALGVEATTRIPHRMRDGYGLSLETVEAAARDGIGLIITVDCGITANEAVARARALGVEVIVTDHHQPGTRLPEAAAIVNPHQEGCLYPFKGLCGVGVAFKLAQALARDPGGRARVEELLDVVALGTIADAVPLVGENRVLARAGLERLGRTPRPGLVELIEIAGLAGGAITAGQVAFLLAPRMNAAGRIGSGEQTLRLLMAQDREQARPLAQSLDQDNNRRRELDAAVEREATERVERELNWPSCASIVLWSRSWHPGVLGIVASRLVERFHRPTFLLSDEGSRARGSGRSVAGFHLVEALSQCSELLEAYGGHAYAAGLTVASERLPALRDRIEAQAMAALDLETCVPEITIDADVPLGDCDLSLLDWLDRLPPHGLENPEPVFRAEDVRIESVSRAGDDGRHLRLQLRDASGEMEAIAFGHGEQILDIFRARRCAIAYVPQRNEWQGETRVQIKVKGVKLP